MEVYYDIETLEDLDSLKYSRYRNSGYRVEDKIMSVAATETAHLTKLNAGIVWSVCPKIQRRQDAALILTGLERFFEDRRNQLTLLTPSDDGRGVRLYAVGLPNDRHICFPPSTNRQGRISCYEEESGCLGEDNRLHDRGTISYQLA